MDAKIQNLYNSYREYILNEDALAPILPELALGGPKLGEAVIPEMAVRKAVVEKSVEGNDIAVVVIGRNAGEADDRVIEGDFELCEAEMNLLKDVAGSFHKAGKKLIVILNVGGVVETASWRDLADAILLAWTPGQEAGHSIADVLTGKSNPSGKLSMTFPIAYFDIPSSANFPYYKPTSGPQLTRMQKELRKLFGAPDMEPEQVRNLDYTEYAEGLNVGYRYFNTRKVDVAYPFGFGLSYTTYEYGKPSAKVAKDGSVTVKVTVKNTGSAAGK